MSEEKAPWKFDESTPLGQWQAWLTNDHHQVKSRLAALEERYEKEMGGGKRLVTLLDQETRMHERMREHEEKVLEEFDAPPPPDETPEPQPEEEAYRVDAAYMGCDEYAVKLTLPDCPPLYSKRVGNRASVKARDRVKEALGRLTKPTPSGWIRVSIPEPKCSPATITLDDVEQGVWVPRGIWPWSEDRRSTPPEPQEGERPAEISARAWEKLNYRVEEDVKSLSGAIHRAVTEPRCARCNHPQSWHRHDDATEGGAFRCIGYDCDAPGPPRDPCGCPDFVAPSPEPSGERDRWDSVTLCERTGLLMNNYGECPEHGGDACLAVYFHYAAERPEHGGDFAAPPPEPSGDDG